MPDPGEGAVSVTYQNLFVGDHLGATGQRSQRGEIRAHTLVTDVDYGLTQRAAISSSLIYATSRYRGPDLLHGPLDTGSYHGALQDANFEMRYSLQRGHGVLTPFAGVLVPTHGYNTVGHSALGRNLLELQLGLAGGYIAPRLLGGVHTQARYGYSIVEHVERIPLNRSNLDLELGTAVRPWLTVRATAGLQRTHGGLVFPGPLSRDDETFHFHDRVGRANFLRLGAAAAISVGKYEVFAGYQDTVAGSTTHAVKGLIVGSSWTFGSGIFSQRTRGKALAPPRRSFVWR